MAEPPAGRPSDRPVPPDLEPDPAEPDWVFEGGLMVATRSGLLRRGHCCGLGCRHCPYVGTPLEHPDRRPPAPGG